MNTDQWDNDTMIRDLLSESGVPESAALQDALTDLRGVALMPAPQPTAEILAAMTPAIAARRSRRHLRSAAIGLAVAAATGLGATGVAAADPSFRAAAGHTVQKVAHFFVSPDGAGKDAGSPDRAPVTSPHTSGTPAGPRHADAASDGGPDVDGPDAVAPSSPGEARPAQDRERKEPAGGPDGRPAVGSVPDPKKVLDGAARKVPPAAPEGPTRLPEVVLPAVPGTN